MSNRKKPRNRKLIARRALEKVDIPPADREVVSRVNATIHWGNVPGIERNDSEVVGTAVIYDDDTQDLIINDDISEDAKKLIYGGFGGVDHFSIMDPEPN